MGGVSDRDEAVGQGCEDWLMWAPLGFLPFKSIERDIQSIVGRTNPMEGQPLSEYYSKQSLLEDFAWGEFFDSCPSLSLCSPSGIVLRISWEVGWRFREPLLLGGFSKAWVFINGDTGIVSTAGVSDRAKQAKRFLAMLMEGLDPAMAYPDSLNETQWYSLMAASDAEDFVPVFSNFDGWAICCAEADRPKLLLAHFCEDFFDISFENWDDRFAVVPDLPDLGSILGAVGRPRKLPNVLAAYRQLYPNGREGVPWKVVLSKLDKAGVKCGLETLRRAIKSEGNAP